VDLVIHGGDVFHRSRALPSLAFQALRPLVEVAESGLPVFIVPGNHERSRIPHERFAAHPNLHIFRQPGTIVAEVGRHRVALSGFPYQRHRVREHFPRVLEETGWSREEADVRLLCMHHCVEGATVGPADYTFRSAPDVIRGADLPRGFAAVLSGHIHRHQILRRDLRGRILPSPVFYPGSTERTAFAEMGEEKGYLVLEVAPGCGGGRLVRHTFVTLPARPMLQRDLHPPTRTGGTWNREALDRQLLDALSTVPGDAVLRIRIHGRLPGGLEPLVGAARLRRMAPDEMNLDVVVGKGPGRRTFGRGSPFSLAPTSASSSH